MKNWITRIGIIFALLVVGFAAVLGGCGGSKDVSGMWHGTMTCPDTRNGGTTDLEAALQQSSQGITGNITWKNPRGAWRPVGNSAFVVSSGVVAGSNISIVATTKLGGGTVTINFKGSLDGGKISGTSEVTVGSIMGGGTIPGTFQLERQ